MRQIKLVDLDLHSSEEMSFFDILDLLQKDSVLAEKYSLKTTSSIVAVLADGVERDLSTNIQGVKTIEFLSLEDPKGIYIYRHSMAHLMAHALIRMFPGTQAAIGPVIKDGFYYDFDINGAFGQTDLPSLEKEMKKIVREALPIVREVWTREEALKYFSEKGDIYKVEIINDLIKEKEVTIYRQGDFLDLCRGVHVPNTSYLQVFSLLKIAGAYWRGSEDNKMLVRIYGTAWANQEDLDSYLEMLEEVKKRDHRKLGKDLGIFAFHEESPGLPFWLPNGVILKRRMIDFMREELDKRDYLEIETPTMLKTTLWEISGHMDNYKENMFFSTTKEDESFALKPMNCPGGILWYKSQPHSYKELPLRVAEFGKVHRYERSGQLHGLIRVRGFTQDDAHVFMTEDQIESEILNAMELIDTVYDAYGFKYTIEFSTRPENSIGSDEMWALSEKSLKTALDKFGKTFEINEGDGAFYGPKIDYHLNDALGRTHQCGTIQLDMNLTERFDLKYVGDDGSEHRLVMIHRAIYGSIERFTGILLEHWGGAFPLWLAPEQVRILPVSEKFLDYAQEVHLFLKKHGVTSYLDADNEKLGYKIRRATLSKIPYVVVVGEKELLNKQVSPRHYHRGPENSMSQEEFLERLLSEIEKKQ